MPATLTPSPGVAVLQIQNLTKVFPDGTVQPNCSRFPGFGYLIGHLKRKGGFSQAGYSPDDVKALIQPALQ